MLRTTRIALLTAALTAMSMTALAQDQETGEIVVDPTAPREAVRAAPKTPLNRPGPLRFYGGFSVAVRGERKEKNVTDSRNLDPTVGLQGGVDYVVMDYFAIGGETRFLWTKPDEQAGRDFLWDLVVKPRGRYELKNKPIEIYGTLPIGLTVPGLDGSAREGKVGFTVGMLGGVNWFFTENFGVNAEAGWIFHRFGEKTPTHDTTYKMNQFLLLCPNFVYAL